MEQIEGGGGRGGEVHGGGRSRWRAPAEVHIRMARSTSSLPSLSSFLPIVRCSSTDAPPPGASFPAIPPALKLATVWIEAAGADGACDGAEWIQKRCCGERRYSGRFIEAMPTEREEATTRMFWLVLCFPPQSQRGVQVTRTFAPNRCSPGDEATILLKHEHVAEERDDVSWNSLVSGYVCAGAREEMGGLWRRRLIQPRHLPRAAPCLLNQGHWTLVCPVIKAVKSECQSVTNQFWSCGHDGAVARSGVVHSGRNSGDIKAATLGACSRADNDMAAFPSLQILAAPSTIGRTKQPR